MNATDLLMRNFNEIFIEIDPVKLHPGFALRNDHEVESRTTITANTQELFKACARNEN